jgi:PAS domain S-box-containing protein
MVLDAGLSVQTASRSFFQLFDVLPEQTIGRPLGELGNGQWDGTDLSKRLDEIFAFDGEFNDFSVDADFPGIGHRSMLLNARRLRNDDDAPPLILLAFEDVTLRTRIETEVAQQREWLRTALSSMVDSVITTDLQTRITFINHAAQRMTGWNSVEAIGKLLADVFNIVDDKTRNPGENPVTKALRDGAVVGLANHTLLIARDKSESRIDDSAAPIRDAQGNIAGVIMVFHDITNRRMTEERLERSEFRYRRLFEAAHDGILIVDANDRKITDVNPFMLQFLDFPREYFIGKELWEIGMFKDRAASEAAMQKIDDTGMVRYDDIPLQNRDGRRLPVEVVANVYQEDRHPVIQCNIRDISERARFDSDRKSHLISEQSLRMEAESANRAKDMFLATLSHELRTPLNAIVGWVSILRQEGCNAEDLLEGLDVIDRNTNAQVRLIEDVLDVSRIVSGKLRLDVRSCELVKVITAAIEVVQTSAVAKNIGIHTEFDLSANEITCDPGRVQQVVWNLLSNAIKFTPKGGSIRVTLDRWKSIARIQVIDTGLGIEPDFLPLLFNRFRQADSTTRRKFGGLGLGLSIARQLMELHGGTVRGESAGAGTGATFTIEIPIRAVVDPEERDDAPALVGIPSIADFPEVRLDGLRVLIVDDEPDSRRAVMKVLQSSGAVVTTAESVKEAMRSLAKSQPEVLVSDIGMPEEDGYDLIRQVRAAGHSARELPAVALTAFAHKEDQRRALLSGFQVHVSKPVDPHDLLAVIGSLAGRIVSR